MPVISRFYGMFIRMFPNEHNPPHIHAIYNEYLVAINLYTFEVMYGEMPPKNLKKIIEWVKLHQDELLKIWETHEFKEISPLD